VVAKQLTPSQCKPASVVQTTSKYTKKKWQKVVLHCAALTSIKHIITLHIPEPKAFETIDGLTV
jgi:hypothetical protein